MTEQGKRDGVAALSEEDRKRIVKKSNERYCAGWYIGDPVWPTNGELRAMAFNEGAEYATKYEREQATVILERVTTTYQNDIQEMLASHDRKQAELIVENERLKKENARLDEIIDEQRRKYARRHE